MNDDAKKFFIGVIVVAFVAALWFVWREEPIQHTQAESEIITAGINVTNAEWLKIKEEQDRRTKEKLEATAAILEALGAMAEAMGD